jgi:hypothetical protein
MILITLKNLISKILVSHNLNLRNIEIAINNGLIEHDIEERFNFKPIYASSAYIQGLDLQSI